MNRRTFLRIATVTSACAIAGCSSTDDDSQPEESGTDTDNGSQPAAETTTDEDSDDSSSPSASSFRLVSVYNPSQIDHDETFTVEVIIENTGDLEGEESVSVSLAGEELDEKDLVLDGHDSETLSFEIDEVGLFSGQYDLTIQLPEDSSDRPIRVDHPNPYEQLTLEVGLEQEVSAEAEIDDIVRDALDYWEEHAETYVDYPIQYEYRPNADDPDVLITVVEDILTCGVHTGEIMGCAPLVTESAPETAEIELVAGYRRDWITQTLKHELGHTLGLDHDDEPAHIMSDNAEDRIPEYTERIAAINAYHDGIVAWNDGMAAWNEAVEKSNDRDYEEAEAWAEEALQGFYAARGYFEDTGDVATELGEDDVADLADEAHSAAEHMHEASSSLLNAVQAYDRRSMRTGDNHIQDANDSVEASDEYDIAFAEDIENGFGFPVREDIQVDDDR